MRRLTSLLVAKVLDSLAGWKEKESRTVKSMGQDGKLAFYQGLSRRT